MNEKETPTLPSIEKHLEKMRYSQDVFQIEIEYAKAVSRVLNLSYDEAAGGYTNIFGAFIESGNNNLDTIGKAWDEFIAESQSAFESGDMSEAARIAHAKYDRLKSERNIKRFGCFSYSAHERVPDKQLAIDIHFDNMDGGKMGPLSRSKINMRKTELSEMIRDIRDRFPDREPQITGASWLYNIPQYRELFPTEYQESLKLPENTAPTKQYLRNMGLWGQFLKADGSVNEPLWREFKQKIDKANSEEDLYDAFRAKVLTPSAPASTFYKMIEK